MNKYTVKATLQVAGFTLAMIALSVTIRLVLDYIDPTPIQLFGTVGSLLMAICFYKLIQIQASILETRDKLNEKK
jgi:hypothetical protein